MKKIIKFLIIILFISTLFPYFTGDPKGILIPYGFIEIGLLDMLFKGSINSEEVLLLVFMLVIQFNILLLFKTFKRKNIILFPCIFLIGYLIINFHDLNFKDWEKSTYSLLPFIIIWIILCLVEKKNKHLI